MQCLLDFHDRVLVPVNTYKHGTSKLFPFFLLPETSQVITPPAPSDRNFEKCFENSLGILPTVRPSLLIAMA